MTKAEIISKISERTGVEKRTATVVVESFMSEIKDSITKDESVFLRGFGTFLAKERKEKTGRNISKNTTIIIPAHHIPSFKPAKVFKEEVKNNVK
jgi:DNA-binding protein HU-beta|tara:strand:+ start:1147 stop:1431 length:285 start_codon:yes stop_codon:yes gene_type:complete